MARPERNMCAKHGRMLVNRECLECIAEFHESRLPKDKQIALLQEQNKVLQTQLADLKSEANYAADAWEKQLEGSALIVEQQRETLVGHEKHNKELTLRVRELEGDSKRLDWWEANMLTPKMRYSGRKGLWEMWIDGEVFATGNTIRQAIDKAMEANDEG